MIRTFLDTNVIVSGLISSSSAPFEVIDAWHTRHFILLISEEIIAEVSKVLEYPKIKKAFSLTNENIEQYILLLSKYSQMTSGELKLDVIKEDPSDNKFLACAVEGNADLIVSGDNHLLNQGAYRGIQILSPREFVRQLKS